MTSNNLRHFNGENVELMLQNHTDLVNSISTRNWGDVTESEPEFESDFDSDDGFKVVIRGKTKSKSKTNTEPKAESESKSKTEPKAKSKSKTKSESESKNETQNNIEDSDNSDEGDFRKIQKSQEIDESKLIDITPIVQAPIKQPVQQAPRQWKQLLNQPKNRKWMPPQQPVKQVYYEHAKKSNVSKNTDNSVRLIKGFGGKRDAACSCVGWIRNQMKLGEPCQFGSKCTFVHAHMNVCDIIIPLNWDINAYSKIANMHMKTHKGVGGSSKGFRTCVTWFNCVECHSDCKFLHECGQYVNGGFTPWNWGESQWILSAKFN
jgi:hypothetical protein